MEMDSRKASLLLKAAMEDLELDMSDSDDCESDDEEIARDAFERTRKRVDGMLVESGAMSNRSEETEDYHKMKNIEDRPYQTELLELAKQKNIIICLPTGSGKTYIALKLTDYILPSAIQKQQKIIFLANNVPLVNQQANYFSKNLVFSTTEDDKVVRALTGDLNVDIWKQEEWDKVLGDCHILVASTQIILDALTKAYIKWSQVALLILDECHHAQKNHPMAELMKLYGKQWHQRGPEGLPRVLGLTATIIKGQSRSELIQRDIEDIEKLLCCKAVTHKRYEEVLRRGWTIFMVRTTTPTTPGSEQEQLKAFFETGRVPDNFELWYKSKQENCDDDVRCSTSTILQVRAFNTNYFVDDVVCRDVNNFMALLDKLPNDFGTEEEKSLIDRINHPSLTSEEQIYNKNKGLPKTLKSFLTDLLKTYKELGPYCGRIAAVLKAIYLMQWTRELDKIYGDDTDSDDDAEAVFEGDFNDDSPSGILTMVEGAKTAVLQFMSRLDKMMKEEASKNRQPNVNSNAWAVKNCVSDKVTVLWNILKEKKPGPDLPEDDQLCGLIFCERRITAQVMRWYLEAAAKEWPNELGFLKPNVMIGHSTIVGDTELARFTAKRQSSIVHKFHQRELNLLVATQVVEEGLNVPACNLVVRLDSINSYPSFVQSLGRARKQGAICYALIDRENDSKEQKKIESYVEYNEELSKTLEKQAMHVGEDEEDVEIGRFADPIPPYNPSGHPNGPMITATDAISIVHRYCSAMSCDKIGTLFPTAWREENIVSGRKYFKARVLLPIMSPIREPVEGDWMPDKTLAKRSAYLKCCILLDKAGELTENLLPKPRSIDNFRCDFLDKLKVLHDEEKKTTVAKVGTRKRAQWYRKRIPEVLNPQASSEAKIVADCPVSIYKVKIKLNKFVGHSQFKRLYDFEQFGKCYGIVTNANLDGLPKFTLKAKLSELEVSVRKCVTKEKSLSKDQIETLEHFQFCLRDSVYGVRNSVLKLESQPVLLIAPLSEIYPHSKEYEVDWQLVQCLLNLDEEEHLLSEPSERSRKEMKFNPQIYEDAVLIPWYKDDVKENPELLCALNVSEKTSRSDFDDTVKYRTYEDYYGKKYGVRLFHPEFPLIQCKKIEKQLNFLTTKVVDYKELSQELQPTRAMIRMVPELLNIHLLPACLYVQGRFLPSILHRIYRLLVANELRLKVAQYFKWNVDRDDELDDSEGEGEDDDVSTNGLSLNDMLCDIQVSAAPENAKANGNNAVQKPKKVRRIKLIEDINPMSVQWEDIEDSFSSPEVTRNSVRDKKFAFPEPPCQKSNVCSNLIDIDKVKSYHFDELTEFTVEPGPKMETLMEALTLSNAQDSLNLEKLEVMGDSVLKLIVSLHVFRSFLRWDEGKMTQMRMKLISNLHLYQMAKRHNVGELLSGSIFIPAEKRWLPPGFTIPENIVNFVLSKEMDYGELHNLPESDLQSNALMEAHLASVRSCPRGKQTNIPHTTYTHSNFGDKSVADCMEAIIGAYYINGGLDGAFRIMDYLGMRGPLEDGKTTKYSRESTMSPVKPDPELLKKQQNLVPMLHSLEQTIQYSFKNPWLAVEALTHPTFMGNRVTPCYERLEYIGDAILDFLVTNWILKETKITDPGEITDLRAALVNNVTFGSLAVKFQFHKALKFDSEPLKNVISRFAEHLEDNDYVLSDPCKFLTDLESNSVREIEVPKVLGDVFESIAGAVFVDSGMSIDEVWKVFYRLMKTELEEFSKNIPKSPLRELYEQYPGKVRFRKPSEIDPSNANPKSKHHIQSRYKTVYLKIPGCDNFVRGEGTTIKQAKQAAAKYILRRLKYPESALF